MTNDMLDESTFQEAYDSIALATWNQPRTDNDLYDFISRREEQLADLEL